MRMICKSLKRVARPERFELPTLWFEARCSIQLSYGRVPPSYQNLRVARRSETFGAGGRHACQIESQETLRRTESPQAALINNEELQEIRGKLVGLGRLELPTSPLSGVRSSHLSYRPNLLAGNILRDLAYSSNDGPAYVSLDYDDGLSGTGAIARKSSRKRRE